MKDPRYPVDQDISLLPVHRALFACVQQSSRVMTRFMEQRGLTPSQFDVLATLGDTEGMTFKELSQRSMVTAGTLTPVLNRMEAKGLVSRCKGEKDSRQTLVRLTPEGQAQYEATFLPFIDHAQGVLNRLTPNEQTQLAQLLDKLTAAYAEETNHV
ncbi:MarR family transcriptional regulator [bacterium]|nr:MarR family transcriptional regulator [bacterium]